MVPLNTCVQSIWPSSSGWMLLALNAALIGSVPVACTPRSCLYRNRSVSFAVVFQSPVKLIKRSVFRLFTVLKNVCAHGRAVQVPTGFPAVSRGPSPQYVLGFPATAVAAKSPQPPLSPLGLVFDARPTVTGVARLTRSEERRVGKECRSRW